MDPFVRSKFGFIEEIHAEQSSADTRYKDTRYTTVARLFHILYLVSAELARRVSCIFSQNSNLNFNQTISASL